MYTGDIISNLWSNNAKEKQDNKQSISYYHRANARCAAKRREGFFVLCVRSEALLKQARQRAVPLGGEGGCPRQRIHSARCGAQDGEKARWVVGRSLTLVTAYRRVTLSCTWKRNECGVVSLVECFVGTMDVWRSRNCLYDDGLCCDSREIKQTFGNILGA